MIINGIEYISGVFRGDGGENMVTHLYRGEFGAPGFPMCSRGWQRKYYDDDGNLEDWEYSIFRNNWTEKGLCRICEKRAEKGLEPISKPKPLKKPKNYVMR